MKRLAIQIRLTLIALLLALSLTAHAPQARAQQAVVSQTPDAIANSTAPALSDLAKRQESFQIVWQTVNELFYDPKFGGVNWAGVRQRYEPLVATVASDREFHQLLQQMVNELHQSHFMVIPKEAIPKIRVTKDPDASDNGKDDAAEAAEDEFDAINYKLTDQLLTGIGIDLRVLDGSAVVTRVEPGSTAAHAGLRPGFVIKKVGDRSLDTVIAEIEKHPLWGSIIRPELPLFLVAGFINGEQSSPVRLRYLDARNRLRSVSISRERLKGEMSPVMGNMPSMYTEFESKRLRGGLGYIRFNAFVPSLMERLCGALRSMKDAPGIILDLRGNQGGLLGMIGGLTGLLENTTTMMGAMQTRGGYVPLFVFPQLSPYSGPLVILVDGSTQSAGEMFASGLQESGRAIVVGEKSAGNTLPSAIKKLPTGALFQYGFANYETSSGKRLEGVGITPDYTVPLSRRNLLTGGDPQLAAAIRKLSDEIRGRAKPGTLVADITNVPPPEPIDPPPAASVKAVKTSPPVVTVIDPPPAAGGPVIVGPKAMVLGDPKMAASNMPSLDSIFEKYLEASGGRSAFEKLNSRVSTGTVEITALGIPGTVEIDEQAPNKSSLIINAPGLGVMQKTFDGNRAWLQDPLQGFIRFTGSALEIVKAVSAFNKQTRLRELYPSPKLLGKEKVEGKDAYVVQMGAEKWFFDASSGLLLRRGSTYYDDYRTVDGIKLPFRIREGAFTGVDIIYQLTEIKHNVKIDDAKFAEYPSCFAKP
jgi:carboxyl-terminal processing protease